MTASVLALLVLVFILIFFVRFFIALDKEPVSACVQTQKLTRKDLLLLLAVLIVYGCVAFHNSGNHYAPETSVHFQAGDEVVISIEERKEASAIKAYTGLNTGRYSVKGCASFFPEMIEIGELNQEYSKLFQWNEVSFYGETLKGFSTFSLTALADLYLNELVILDNNGVPLKINVISFTTDAEALFDEQDKYTENSYLSGSYFDEIYHARTALEHVEGVRPYEITHPPLGKIIISLGIRIFGMNPFGWRFSGILFGILMLIPFYVLTKSLFSDTLVSVCATFLFAFDFMHFTQTRIATIDTYSVFFILLMYLFMYLYVSSETKRYLWLGLCGVSFGFGCACKWTSVYAGFGLALIWLTDFIGQVRSVCRKESRFSDSLKNIGFCIVFFIAVPALIYYLSYIPYGKAEGLSGMKMLLSREYFRTVADNQQYMFNYHSNIVADHPYSSRWYEWTLDVFPMLYYLKYVPDGGKSVISCFVTPLLCWSGLISVLYLFVKALFEREERSVFILIAYLAQLAPWIFIKRLTFEYHYFPSSVFMILSIAAVFSDFRQKERHARAYILSFTSLSLLLFVLFYPVISGMPVSQNWSSLLRWLPKWYL